MSPIRRLSKSFCVRHIWYRRRVDHMMIPSTKELQRLLAIIQTQTIFPLHARAKVLLVDAVGHDHEFNFSTELQFFINSSNGLILDCTRYGKHPSIYYKCNVHNPLTGKCVALPDQPKILGSQDNSLALVCQENTHKLVASYKVIVANRPAEDKTWSLTTYSSETGIWTPSTVTMVADVRLDCYPIVLNGFVHWLNSHARVCGLVVYDSNRDNVQQIHLPDEIQLWLNISLARSGSGESGDDDLLLGAYHRECIKFWMLPKGSSATSTPQWILKYSFNIYSLAKDIISTVEKENGSMLGDSADHNACTLLAALLPWKAHVAVLRSHTKKIFSLQLGEQVCGTSYEQRSTRHLSPLPGALLPIVLCSLSCYTMPSKRKYC